LFVAARAGIHHEVHRVEFLLALVGFERANMTLAIWSVQCVQMSTILL